MARGCNPDGDAARPSSLWPLGCEFCLCRIGANRGFIQVELPKQSFGIKNQACRRLVAMQSLAEGRLVWLKAVDGPIMKYICSMATPALLALLLSCTGVWADSWEVSSVSCEAQLINHRPKSRDHGSAFRYCLAQGCSGSSGYHCDPGSAVKLSGTRTESCYPSGSQREFRCLACLRLHLGERGPAERRCRCTVSRHGGASGLGEASHPWSAT